jgi:hypothetical protein
MPTRHTLCAGYILATKLKNARTKPYSLPTKLLWGKRRTGVGERSVFLAKRAVGWEIGTKEQFHIASFILHKTTCCLSLLFMQYAIMHYVLIQDGQRTLRLSHQLSLYDLARWGLCHLLADDAIANLVTGGTARLMGGATGLCGMAREKRGDSIIADPTVAGSNHRCLCRLSSKF